MKMTFMDYINNPMGKKNMVFSQRKIYYDLYTQKLSNVLVKEAGNIKYELFKDKSENYWIKINIPSEVVPKFYYDVIIKFWTDLDSVKGERTLNNYYVQFYSNDPSFVFTFAHSFITNEIFVKELQSKMSKKAVKENADERNPRNEVGYVKSLFFTFLYMKSRKLFSKDIYMKSLPNMTIFKSYIMDADRKIELRQEAQTNISHAKKVQKNKEKNSAKFNSMYDVKSNRQMHSSNNMKITTKTGGGKIRHTSKVGRTKTASKVRTTTKSKYM